MAIAVASDAPPFAGLAPLFDTDALRRADERAASVHGMPEMVLMERAGLEAARVIDERFGAVRRCTVLVGRGNNGGDGMVVARHLAEWGWSVSAAGPEGSPQGAHASAMAGIAATLDIEVRDPAAVWPREDELLVDAMLGTGARGAPTGPLADVVERAMSHPGPVVAIDVPSGVSASTGEVPGCAVRADLTVTFSGDMVGLRVSPGSERAGEVRVVDIGVPGAVREPAAAWFATSGVLGGLPRKAARGEKYGAGAVLVVGGSPGMTGAPGMAARAVLRAGGGLVVAAVPAGGQPLVAPAVPEAMVTPIDDEHGFLAERSVRPTLAQTRRVGAVALGPGLGRAECSGDAVRRLVSEVRRPLVVDADGLWHLGRRPAWLADRPQPTVLTPHGGEAARLLGRDREDVEASRLEAASELAELTGAVVVLKGPGTITGAPGMVPIVNGTGSAALSTAGTGDVLTGVVAALLAKGMPAWRAAALAVALHGVAGELSGRGDGTIAGDVIDALPRAREASGA